MNLEEKSNNLHELLNMIESLHTKCLKMTQEDIMLKSMSHDTLNNPKNKIPSMFFEGWNLLLHIIRKFYYDNLEELNKINKLYNTLYPLISLELTLTQQLTIAKIMEINILLKTINTFVETNIQELHMTDHMKNNNISISS